MAQAKYEIRRKCPICGAVFQIRTIDSVYCSKQCSDVAYKRKKDREAKEARYEQLAKEIPEIREFLSVQEAVAIYCVERDTLYREIRKGKIARTASVMRVHSTLREGYFGLLARHMFAPSSGSDCTCASYSVM
jgi:endogenous inhibitor of DNA gyrase (YacG/DUF329 family)